MVRSDYPDKSKAERAARRYALQDAAANRMGFRSWQVLGTAFRQAMEHPTNREVDQALVDLLAGMGKAIAEASRDPDSPADDTQAVLIENPPKKKGRIITR